MIDDARYLRLALDACRRGVDAGQSPFGACIVREGSVLACAFNRVAMRHDPTAHAEVEAIRLACAEAGTLDLSGAAIYSTTEPCPMCFGAIHWARMARIVFGARVTDAARFGFHELKVDNATLKKIGGSAIDLRGDVLRAEALELFEVWKGRGGKPY